MTDNKQNSPVESKAAFAKRLVVNRSTITRAAQSGRIVLNGDGKVLINESLARWDDTKSGRLDVQARHAKARGHQIGTGRLDQADLADFEGLDDFDTSEGAVGQLANLKAQALEARNQMALIERALEKGDMVEMADHLGDVAKIGAQLRQAVENLIDNIAPQISGINQPGLVDSRIKRAVHELGGML